MKSKEWEVVVFIPSSKDVFTKTKIKLAKK